MTVTVEVNATWRLSRIEISLLQGYTQTIMGAGEVLLQEPANPSPDAAILQNASIVEDPKTYGSMPAAPIRRDINDALLAETVNVDVGTIDFRTVMQALGEFLERWRAEDATQPVPAVPVP
ncbi:MAG TPA: hypothetical protein VF077_05395 [Nitrospiraceae bacterium]